MPLFPYFPHRINVAFVRVLAPNRLEARFWERGAGCEVTIVTEGGEMVVCWRDDELAELARPAEFVATGSLFP